MSFSGNGLRLGIARASSALAFVLCLMATAQLRAQAASDVTGDANFKRQSSNNFMI